MKLNLGCGEDVRSGMLNVDIKPKQGVPAPVFRQGDVSCLDWLCENGSVEEILALNIIDHIPLHQISSTITGWINKIKAGGVIKISFPDIGILSRSYHEGIISNADFLKILFGTEGDERKSAMDANTMCDLLKNQKLTIISKRYDGVSFYVEATKNEN